MKSLLVVDFDGTLCFDRFWKSLDPVTMGKVQALIFGEDKELIRDWMRGRCRSEDINKLIAEKLRVPYEKLWQLFVNDCQTMSVSVETLKLIQAMRIRWHAVLLTDNMDCFSRFVRPALQLDNYFGDVLNSADHGHLKSDHEGHIFLEVAQKFRVPMASAVLIDNSHSACEHFAQRGGNACLVTKQQPVEYWLEKLHVEVKE